MAVIPFVPRATGASERPLATVPSAGAFPGPDGKSGAYRGSYRLERLGMHLGQLTASGVFTGELCHADGVRIGIGSTRQRCAAYIVETGPALVIRLAPARVSLLGLTVRTEELTIRLPERFRPNPGRESMRHLTTTGRRASAV